jgi:hypothetical protein
MKAIILLSAFFLSLNLLKAQDGPEVLIGTWRLDMTPHKADDNQFAMMEIKSVSNGKLEGTFYRSGVKIRNGQINDLTGRVYGSLISGDNSGSYNTSFYFENGKLYGTTHAVNREFLSVWVAVKEDNP